MDVAHGRVKFVLDFARNWRDLRTQPDYERQRALCRLHLDWIQDNGPSNKFTFRDLIEFSEDPQLSNVGEVREKILMAFDDEALHDVLRDVPFELAREVGMDFLERDGEPARVRDRRKVATDLPEMAVP